jgi:hypothetical protein
MIKKTGMKPHEILDFIIKTQELDTKEQIGRSNNAKVLFMSQCSQQTQAQSNIPKQYTSDDHQSSIEYEHAHHNLPLVESIVAGIESTK